MISRGRSSSGRARLDDFVQKHFDDKIKRIAIENMMEHLMIIHLRLQSASIQLLINNVTLLFRLSHAAIAGWSSMA